MPGIQKVYIGSQSGGKSSWGNGSSKFTVAANAGSVAKTAVAGTLCRAVVVTTGTAAAAPGLLFYDGTDATGVLIGAIPGNAAAGTSFTFMMPVATGIFVVQPANGPVVTVSYE